MATLRAITDFHGMNNRIRVQLTERADIGVRPFLHSMALSVQRVARSMVTSSSVGAFVPTIGNVGRSDLPSGRLANSIRITHIFDLGEGTLAVQIGSDLYYALWVEEGTGIFGPHATPIVPVSATHMVFLMSGFRRTIGSISGEGVNSKLIHATQVRGQIGKHYLRDALRMGLLQGFGSGFGGPFNDFFPDFGEE